MREARETSPAREHVLGTSAAILQQLDRLENQAREVLSTAESIAVRHIVLTGCGDSHMAALCVKLSFERLLGVPVEAAPAMTAGRYTLPALAGQAPHSPLVIGISNSGKVARTFEAVQTARSLGAQTIALTTKPESRTGKAAERILLMESAPLPHIPGFYGYALSMVALYHLAIHMAEARGRFTREEACAARRSVQRAVEALDRVAAAVDTTVRELAAAWSGHDNFEFLGSGPSYGTAAFGAAKVLETTGTHAWAEELEEWVHLHYFVAKPAVTPVFLIAPAGSLAESRAVEVSKLLVKLGRPGVVVTGPSGQREPPYAVPTVEIPEEIDEAFSPLLYTAPLLLFASYLAERTGGECGRGFSGPWEDAVGGMTVLDSHIMVPREPGAV